MAGPSAAVLKGPWPRWRSAAPPWQSASTPSWASSAGRCSSQAGGGWRWWRAGPASAVGGSGWRPVVLASCASHSEPSRLDVSLEVSAQVHYQVGFASLELDPEFGGELGAAGDVGGGPSLVAGSR